MRYWYAVVAISILLALFGAELFLRFAAPVTYMAPPEHRNVPGHSVAHRASAIPGLTYELVPGIRVNTAKGWVETNRFGMRDDELELRASPGTTRIAALGDSVTFGFGVTGTAAYPSVLERCLNDRLPTDPAYEVLNFGVGGYSTQDEIKVLEAKASRYEPDHVLLGYVLNDPETDPIQPLHAYFTPPTWWQSFHLGRLVAQVANSLALRRYGNGDYIRYLHAEPGKWGSVLAGFDELKNFSLRHNYSITVAIFPLIPTDRWTDYLYADLHAQVANAASERGFGVIDLLPAFVSAAPSDIRVSGEDQHPNALGHRLAATAICDHMLALESRKGYYSEGVAARTAAGSAIR